MNQTVTNNNSLNNLVFNKPTAQQQQQQQDIQSPSSPPPPPTILSTLKASTAPIMATTIIPTQQLVAFNTIKLPPQQDEMAETGMNSTRKIIRTSPPATSAVSTPPSHLLIQTVSKKPIHNINLAAQSPTSSSAPKPITITTVNSPTTASSSYLPSSSSNPSSRINLPITTLTPIQLQAVTSTTSTPVINKITKCSQSFTAASSPSSSSSPPTNSLSSVLNPSTTAKLILNGSVNGTNSPTPSNEPPITLKLTTPHQRPITQQQVIKTLTAPTVTTTITNSTTPSTSLSTSIPKILLSTTPIQLNSTSSPASPLPTATTTNLVLPPRFLITTTTSSSNGTSVTNPTFSTAPINIKNFGSKLNDTLNKPINFLNSTAAPVQHHHHHHHRTTVSTHLLEAQTAAKAAEANLINFINGTNRLQISQLVNNQRLNIVTIPQPQVASTSAASSDAQTRSPTPNIIKKTKSKSDLLDFQSTNDSSSTSESSPPTDSPKQELENAGVELRPLINSINGKTDIIKLKTAAPSTLHKNQSKMILNMPAKCSPSIEFVNSSDQQQSLKVQQITTLQFQQSPVRDLLNPSNFNVQQSAIIHIPCSLTASSSFEAASILGTFIQHQATTAAKNTDSAQHQTNETLTTLNGRKRHINEFDFSDRVESIKAEDTTGEQPAHKQSRLSNSSKTDTASMVKLKANKRSSSKEALKSVDNNNNNVENVDLNVNKCTMNALDDETVRNLSKEFVYYDSYGIKWISKNAKHDAHTLNRYYKPPWKPKNNHFLRYSDIKVKDETKTISEMVMEKEKLKGVNDWTFHYVISQFQELVSFENESLNLMADIENVLKSRCNHDNKIYETIKANSQRHVYVTEQLNEAHLLIQGLIKSNKNKFLEILNRTPTATTPAASSEKLTRNSGNANKTQQHKTPKSMFSKHNMQKSANSNKSPIKSKLKSNNTARD